MNTANITSVTKELCEPPHWNYFTEELSRAFRLTEKESKELYKSTVARIIAAIPFVAGCESPERTAIAHLSLYEVELKGFEKYCGHQTSDDADIMERLKPIADFEGGNRDVIHHGMTMLALIMLEGYNRSRGLDFSKQVYNPLNSGAWNYKELKVFLTSELRQIEVPLLDEIYFANDVKEYDWH